MSDNKDQQQILLSTEKQFIYRDSFNRGVVQVPRMVAKCIGLSLQAKGVYSFISTFVYEHGRSAFPSIHNIAVGCGIAASSAVRYINELVTKGFILRVRRGRGKTNDYYIVDADKVNLLWVSEMLWEVGYSIVSAKKERDWEQIYEALKYVEDQLEAANKKLSDLEVTKEMKEIIKAAIEILVEGGEPEQMVFIRSKPNNVTPTAQASAPQERKMFGDSSVPYYDRDEDTWSISNFIDHFYRRFILVTGQNPVGSLGMHQGIMKRCLKQMDGESKHDLKKYIDTFFDMGYDIQTIEWFGINGRIGEIRTFLSDGTKPFYLTEKYKKGSPQSEIKDAVQERQGLSLEELDKLLLGGG